MKKILTLSIASVMAFGIVAQADDDNPANERFHQKSTNFGGTAANGRDKSQPTVLPHKYVLYRRAPSNQNTAPHSNGVSSGNGSHFNNTANSYTANGNNSIKSNSSTSGNNSNGRSVNNY